VSWTVCFSAVFDGKEVPAFRISLGLPFCCPVLVFLIIHQIVTLSFGEKAKAIRAQSIFISKVVIVFFIIFKWLCDRFLFLNFEDSV